MYALKSLILIGAAALVSGQQYNQPTTTPVPILKQINRQNDDGSYSFGYEAADGSFKVETKYPNGDVAGKYGYVDEGGQQREISYGASSQRGFEPAGSGIMVPPPTLNDPKASVGALADGQEDDGQYREDPRIYEDPKYNGKSKNRPSANFNFEVSAPQPQRYQQPKQAFQQSYQPSAFRSTPSYKQQSSLFDQGPAQFTQPAQPQYQAPQPQYQAPQPQYQAPQPQYQAPQPQYQQEYRPQSQVYHQQPQFSYSGYTQPQQYNQQPYNPNLNYNPFQGHPATNFDPSTGSYTINFTG